MDFLRFVKEHLKENGKCVILCPNYSFPYESHFGVPVIFSKSLTFNIFQRYIKKFEQDNSSNGLWSSLNFVKLKQVIKAAAQFNQKKCPKKGHFSSGIKIYFYKLFA